MRNIQNLPSVEGPNDPRHETGFAQRRVFHFREKAAPRALSFLGVNVPATIDVRHHFESIRNKLIEKYPSNTEGLNLERVRRFSEQYNFRDVPSIIIDTDQHDDYVDYAKHIGAPRPLSEAYGEYNPLLDLITVYRNAGLERENSSAIAESWLVHEMAHASSGYTDIVGTLDERNKIHTANPRVGFALGSRADYWSEGEKPGSLLEEGYAEWMRGKYITEYLNLPNGFTRVSESVGIVSLDQPEKGIPVPTKYTHLENNSPTMAYASCAGVVVEFLVDADPSLDSLLHKSRSDVTALREVSQKINKITPGLYTKLRDEYGSSQDKRFFMALQHVYQKLYLDKSH